MSVLSSTSEHPSRAGISSFALKLAAIAGMTANHACHIFSGYLPAEAFAVLFGFGGLTFPIMAFLLVEGYRHTSNLRRYAARLLVFALVSQVPYALFLADDLNVLFTLLIGLALLHLNDTVERRALFWAAVAALTAVSALCDWGVLGPIMILMMRLIPDRRERVVYPLLLPIAGMGLPMLSELASNPDLETLGQVLYPLAGCTACIPLLLAYNGRRGQPLKWLFYAYYPAHILVLGVAKGLLLGDWSPAS